MKERPILFSAPMVRAILSGAKTQTRRVVKPQPFTAPLKEGECYVTAHEWRSNILRYGKLPYGQPGDRLWVRETWGSPLRSCKPSEIPVGDPILYRADYPADGRSGSKLWPSIFMLRWMSRITLEIVSVRVERLQNISEADAKAEGLLPCSNDDYSGWGLPNGEMTLCPRHAFESLWDSINGKQRPGRPDISWSANPWVWVVEFRRLEGGDA